MMCSLQCACLFGGQVPTGSRIHRHHPRRSYSEGSLSAWPVRLRAEWICGEQEPAAPDQWDRAPQGQKVQTDAQLKR